MVLALVLVTLLFVSRPLEAVPSDIEWKIEKQVTLDAPPLEIAVSPDGEWIYILSFNEVLVYRPQEQKTIKRIPVEAGFDSIALLPKGEGLVLTNSFTKVLKIIRLDVVHEIPITDNPYKGPTDAPIVIVTFTDFQCPVCVRFDSLLELVYQAYPNHVKLVHKNFPLAMHRFARKAAMAALAAERQGKFWEFHDRLFENYNTLNDEMILRLAEELGLDMEQFKNDMDDPAIQEAITRDMRDGYLAGVRGTPTVFVNGKRLQNRTFAAFQEIIKERFPDLAPVRAEEQPKTEQPAEVVEQAPMKEPQEQEPAPPTP